MAAGTGTACAASHDQHLAEAALHMGKAHCAAVEAHVETMLLLALRTVAAGAAGAAWIDGDALARLQAGNFRANARNRSGDLVAQNHRLAQPHGAEAAIEIVVEVGAADAAGLDAHLDLAGTEWRGGHRLDAKILGRVQYRGAHDRPPGSCPNSTPL
jgi:hypothetical protein